MFVIMENDFNVFCGYIPFTKDTIDIAGEPYRIYLDAKKDYTVPSGLYNDDTYLTTISLSTIYGMKFGRGRISAVAEDGRVWTFEQPEDGWGNAPTLSFEGDLTGVRLFIGFNFNFRYVFSKLLIKKTAEDGSMSTEDIGRLQLRRAWVNYEDSGSFDVEVENLSRVFKYTLGGARLGSNGLRVGRLNIGTGQFRYPVVGDARTNEVRVISDHTTPLNIIGSGWEGNYIRKSSGI